MKIIKFFIPIIIAIVAASCIGEPSRSPSIQTYTLYVNSDTIASTQKTPVAVGDTLKILMDLCGYYDDLEYFYIKTDREYTKDSIADQDEFLSYCNPLYTNSKEGTYSFNSGIKNLRLTLYLIPKRAKEDESQKIPVSLCLKSKCDTKEEYNPFYLNFNYYITNKK